MAKSRKRSSISTIAVAIAAVILISGPASLAQQMSPIVLFTSKEQIPLKAYAEMMRAGILQIVSGSAKDIPTVTDVSYFRCALTGWAPKGVLVASEELFKSETAERRLLPLFLKPVAVSTFAPTAAASVASVPPCSTFCTISVAFARSLLEIWSSRHFASTWLRTSSSGRSCDGVMPSTSYQT